MISGNYTISITDSFGCIGPTDTFQINEPSDIIVNHLITNVSCFGQNDGAINLTINGGSGNYNTVWTGNAYFNIAEDIFTLLSGLYTYSVTDANGCTPFINNSPLLVSQPLDVELSSISTDETCFGDMDGSIDITLIGSGVFNYNWIGPNLFNSSILTFSPLEKSMPPKVKFL